MSKNSPKMGGDRLPTDGSVSPFETSTAIREGGGGTDTVEQEPTAFSFALERVILSLLAELSPGQVVEFTEESAAVIAATRNNKVIGYVPKPHLKRVQEAIARGATAAIEDVSHESVRVRVTE